MERTPGYIALALALALGACAPTPLPQDRMNYVGLWVASDRYISIFPEGRLEYKEKLSLGMHNRVESNMEFKGDTIEAMMSTFKIDAPPTQDGGETVMVIDGVKFRRTGAPVIYGRSANWPAGIE